MELIGRKKEQDTIRRCLESNRPEFIVVYGRRRVGKTFLIKEYFNNSFSFYTTGASDLKTKGQLRLFNEALVEYGNDENETPKDWFEAFSRLKKILEREDVRRDPLSGKRVIFLDELPWMDTARSDFKSALDYFWNSWASSQADLVLIVCGSATSWIIDNILTGTGGFYNRITCQIHLKPFTLAETEALFKINGVPMTRAQIIESYMVFGGIPYYINLFDKRLSLSQNIDELLFKESGQLYFEYERLFMSLFKNYKKHVAVIELLSNKKSGLSRTELSEDERIGGGETLTNVLNELEQSGFIRKYKDYTMEKKGFIYQIIDPFVLFCISFVNSRKISSWMQYVKSASYYSWAGYAFEIVCLNHVAQIKSALGVSGVETMEYYWRSKKNKGGAQIDLIIDRKDDVINICEIKHSSKEFVIDEGYEKQLNNKLETFKEEAKVKKALHLTMITLNGLRHNEYSGIVVKEIGSDDLFT